MSEDRSASSGSAMRKPSGSDAEQYAEEARQILKAEMARRGFSFKRLAAVLNALDDGESESVQTLINKVNRGRFSFAFFLRVGRAMGMSSVDIAPLREVPLREPSRSEE